MPWYYGSAFSYELKTSARQSSSKNTGTKNTLSTTTNKTTTNTNKNYSQDDI